jgi:hypothetical protein
VVLPIDPSPTVLILIPRTMAVSSAPSSSQCPCDCALCAAAATSDDGCNEERLRRSREDEDERQAQGTKTRRRAAMQGKRMWCHIIMHKHFSDSELVEMLTGEEGLPKQRGNNAIRVRGKGSPIDYRSSSDSSGSSSGRRSVRRKSSCSRCSSSISKRGCLLPFAQTLRSSLAWHISPHCRQQRVWTSVFPGGFSQLCPASHQAMGNLASLLEHISICRLEIELPPSLAQRRSS